MVINQYKNSTGDYSDTRYIMMSKDGQGLTLSFYMSAILYFFRTILYYHEIIISESVDLKIKIMIIVFAKFLDQLKFNCNGM